MTETPSGICSNCRVAAAEIISHGMHLCNDCNRKICNQLDQISDLYRINRDNWGNAEGRLYKPSAWKGRNGHWGASQ